eukprot:NODE_1902_length_716_cov_59.274363_g1482_i0.p2 GENE.NODE_1902_length_716_cov_59.274363_g1482_i0~~NODE_1902_length_716_cov_59.274363_g1482_i0.p2  ORF type:complete len:98 (-),score=8.70 NODE_1902_length_716_cov_59.274363_g1482_i0:382-675(-)
MQHSVEKKPKALAFEIEVRRRDTSLGMKKGPACLARLEASLEKAAEGPSVTREMIEEKLSRAAEKRKVLATSNTITNRRDKVLERQRNREQLRAEVL